MSKWWRLVLVPFVLATVLFGTLYAQQVETVTVGVTAQSGGALVKGWTTAVKRPAWTPIEGTVGTITPGGLFDVEVPAGSADPLGTWTIAVYLRNPAALNEAYSFLNMEIQVRTALAGDQLWGGELRHSDLLNPDKGYVVFSVESVHGLGSTAVAAVVTLTVTTPATVTGDLTVSVTPASGAATAVTVAVAAGDNLADVATKIQAALAANAAVAANYTVTVEDAVVTLTAQGAGAGQHAIAFNAGGTGVTATTVKTTVGAEDEATRKFSVGIGEGSFYTKSVTNGSLQPSFTVEVRGR